MVGMIKGCFGGGGGDLPALTNPATAADILNGKQIINPNDPTEIITGTIPSKAAAQINITRLGGTISAGQYLDGAQTIPAEPNLLPGNIKDGVSIFGVEGAFSGDVAIGTFQVSSAAASYTLTGFGNFTPRYFAAVIQSIGENELYDAAACLIYGPSYRRMGILINSNWEFRPSSLSSSAVSFDEGEVAIDLGSKYLLPGTYVYLVAG
ncbi:MAG: hypothetical protein K6B40_05320 [Firmicutes bacterium]|nr:hypothetical protein [Bacillota bacterium]